jgi:hypothetical protein
MESIEEATAAHHVPNFDVWRWLMPHLEEEKSFRHKDNQNGVPFKPKPRLEPVVVDDHVVPNVGLTIEGHIVHTRNYARYGCVLGQCVRGCPDSDHDYLWETEERPPLFKSFSQRFREGVATKRKKLSQRGFSDFGKLLPIVMWKGKEVKGLGQSTTGHSVWRRTRKGKNIKAYECHLTKCAKCNAIEAAKLKTNFFSKQSKKRKRSTGTE